MPEPGATSPSHGQRDHIPFPELFPILLALVLVPLHAMSHALYAGLGRPFPEALAALVPLGAWLVAYAWFDAYRQRHGLGGVMDMGYFFYFLWWLLIPYYLFRTQRLRALLPLGAFLGYALLAWVMASVVQAGLSGR